MEWQYKEILDAINELDAKESMQEIFGNERCALIDKIEHLFVKGTPRVWWESLSNAPILVDDEGSSDQFLKIPSFLTDKIGYYFIADLKRHHVFKGRLQEIIEIIGSCSFLEYYIVDTSFTTLLCETEHGAIFLSKRDNI